MSVTEKPVAPESSVVASDLAAAIRPTRRWISFVPVVAFWALIVLTDRLDVPLFVRFASRVLGGLLLTLFALVWWWANRRTPLRDRVFGFAVVVLGGAVAVPLSDQSAGLASLGINQGPLQFVISVWMLAVLLTRRSSLLVKRLVMVVTVSCAWALLALVRLNGLDSDLRPEFHWRWTPTAEDQYLAERAKATGPGEGRSADAESAPLAAAPGDWTGFRGPSGDGTVRGAAIRTDWKSHAPELVWRRRVGPGWSSVLVVAGRVFTQEQHGDREAVSCYDAATGNEVWSHEDNVRFTEETAGPGPRATPCFADGRVFALGCACLLNALDAASGKRLWSHDLAAKAGAELPHWGFTSSPLVVGDQVVAFAGGKGDKNLFAFNARTGDLAWAAPAGQTSYASPQPATLCGVPQVLMWSNHGLTAVDAGTGAVLWEHVDPISPSAPRSVQPRTLGDSRVLLASGPPPGLTALELDPVTKPWTVSKAWFSAALKPEFNDFVVSQGHAFGFDGRIFTCVDLETGSRRWKEGRYGEGQVVLLADQSLLLVISENGEAILLRANPERSEELGRFQAVHGKTWNQPAVVNGRVYARNAEEMTCYDVSADAPPDRR
jgi:outer membrane protein assembly factor BamB